MTILNSFAMAFRRHPIQILLELGYAGLMIILAVGGFSRVAPGLLQVPDQPDFEIYYQAARALNLGQPLYVPDPPRQPHLSRIMLHPATSLNINTDILRSPQRYARPLAVLRRLSAKGIWYLLNFVFLALAVALTCKLVGAPRQRQC